MPLVIVSGGPRAYWHALFDQGAEDLSGIRMLWTTPTVRELADALYYAFVAPWAVWPFAAVVIVLATAGVCVLRSRHPRALTLIAIAFGPYLLFDIVFQETFTSRYALPLVVPVAFLAAAGARALPFDSGVVAMIAFAMFGAHLGGTSLAAYAHQPAPAFRLLADMQRDISQLAAPPVLAMDRRESFDLRRPTTWLNAAAPRFAAQLPSPPQHEWLEPAKYWAGGGRAPVWFVADPRRTDIELIQHGEPQPYRYALPYPVLIDGVRPYEMDWYELDRPEWWVGQGWALTPEAAGVSDTDRRGLAYGPIEGRLAYQTLGGALLVGGRNFEPTTSYIDLAANGRSIAAFTARPGFFLHAERIPTDLVERGAPESIAVSVRATPPARVAIEQFDASATRTLAGFGDGWHEQEYNPDTGLRWRWVSDHGELQLVWPRPQGGAILRIDGESPRKYFSRGSRLTIRADGRAIFDEVLSSDFSLHVPIPEAKALTFDVDQFYVPAERSWRSGDRRRLALRIFKCAIVQASVPGR